MEGKDSIVYNRYSGNQFIPKATTSQWKVNDLILKDQDLRKRSGVYILDQGITEVYMAHGNSGNI